MKTIRKRHFVTYSKCPNRLREDSYLNSNISVICQALNKTDRLRQCQRVHTECPVEEFKSTEIKAIATHFDHLVVASASFYLENMMRKWRSDVAST